MRTIRLHYRGGRSRERTELYSIKNYSNQSRFHVGVTIETLSRPWERLVLETAVIFLNFNHKYNIRIMTGVLFIVNVPHKEYEDELRKQKSIKTVMKDEKHKDTSKLVGELKENKQFSIRRNHIDSFNEDINISMCKYTSTDYLHKEDSFYEGKGKNSEDVHGLDPIGDKKTYLRSSWEEIKQVKKTKRNKLKITRSGGSDILNAFHWDTPLETILSEVIMRLNVKNAAWNSTKDDKFWQVTFSLESGHLCEELLQVLRTFGVGSRHQSLVSIIPCALYYKSSPSELPGENDSGPQSDTDSAWSRFSSSVRSRTNLAQVLHDVRAEAALTFDWLFLLVVAAFVAAIGLVENSTVILVASMLISPLMGPITAATLGTAVRDRSLQQMGLTHELFGLFLSLVIGFIFGLAICAVDEHYGVGDWPTYEMMSRCEIRSLWVGLLVAVPSGAGVALAVLGDYTASLVGVAISASLLPPAVNAGLLWAMALVHLIFLDDDNRFTSIVKTTYFSTNQPTELAVLGSVSLCLTLVNIICIFFAGVVVYKVKKVFPLERRDISWWRANRNLLQNSKNEQHENNNKPRRGTSLTWDIYSKWMDETKKKAKEMEDKKEANVGAVQSDTVTFRRHQPAPRLKAQNIEDYCQRHGQVMDIYMPIPIDPRIAVPDDVPNEVKVDATDKGFNQVDPDVTSVKEDHSMKTENPVDYNDLGFYNAGFVEDVENIQKIIENCDVDKPTIEPSLSFTVDSKNYLVLGSKTFHV